MGGDDRSVVTPPAGAPHLAAEPNADDASQGFPVVGIGASAGGLRAVGDLLAALPEDLGMALVVVQHLDPRHESQMAALLGRVARLPIEDAADGCALRPNRVYLITPNTSLAVDQGRLRLTPRTDAPGPHLPIDAFLRSLASDRPGRAIGVILSGEGSDGTLGLAAIKAAGGCTFAQDESAEHAGMPRSAARHGHVDFVLPPGEIAKALGQIARFGFPQPPSPSVQAAAETAGAANPALAEDPEHYAIIMERVRVATGNDFTQYRSSTIHRRTRRRMAMLAITDLAAYVRYLEEHPEEIEALARDILIHVTSFFRDPAAFDLLRRVVFPGLMAARADEPSPIRIWVVGCSTGQEVYSLAIELLEFLGGPSTQQQIQIFASDISDQALDKARLGLYPETIAEQVPEARLAAYFTREEHGYRIIKDIRNLCVFAKHDVAVDVPFSRIDLITCRNVLIYLGPTLQKNVIPTFHFSLRLGGHLLLGTSETIGRATSLFETVDEKHRLYRSVACPRRFRPTHQIPSRTGFPGMPPPSNPSNTPSITEMQRAADQVVLGRYAPAGVLITDAMEIIQLRGRTDAYLRLPSGEPTFNLLTMVPFAVAGALREALNEAKQSNRPIRRERVPFRRDESFREIVIEIVPITLLPANAACYLVQFEEIAAEGMASAAPPAAPPGSAPANPTAEQRELAQLRSELASANVYFHSIVEQNHALMEQLKAAQEEAQSSTEEYRTTSEEMQTAKEEIESTNEELVTINDELRAANEELARAAKTIQLSADLTEAILETTRLPLLVLNPDLSVERANQAFFEAFRVTREETIGRPIYELGNGQWNIPALRRLLEDILPKNAVFDDFEVTHEFSHIGLRTMLLNARRLRGDAARAQLIVLVIADVTEQTRATRTLKDLSHELLRSNDELDQFAAVASHDLQEPLRMMSSYIGMLQRQYDPLFDDRAREYMAYVVSGAQRMTDMIKAILTYSRIGHEASDMVELDCENALRSAVANLRGKIEQAQARIEDGSLPHARANQQQLTQLFQNLLSNALKFRDPARPVVITVRAVDSGREWTFSVADNGIGMEPGSFGKIFQLFQRLDNAQKTSGTGIGLATCKKIVEHHRGRIWVESKVGEGSTFFFTLPK